MCVRACACACARLSLSGALYNGGHGRPLQQPPAQHSTPFVKRRSSRFGVSGRKDVNRSGRGNVAAEFRVCSLILTPGPDMKNRVEAVKKGSQKRFNAGSSAGMTV